jgi:hypothetical protein
MMGTGIADLFMRPYNYKVWAVPTTKVSEHKRARSSGLPCLAQVPKLMSCSPLSDAMRLAR